MMQSTNLWECNNGTCRGRLFRADRPPEAGLQDALVESWQFGSNKALAWLNLGEHKG